MFFAAKKSSYGTLKDDESSDKSATAYNTSSADPSRPTAAADAKGTAKAQPKPNVQTTKPQVTTAPPPQVQPSAAKKTDHKKAPSNETTHNVRQQLVPKTGSSGVGAATKIVTSGLTGGLFAMLGAATKQAQTYAQEQYAKKHPTVATQYGTERVFNPAPANATATAAAHTATPAAPAVSATTDEETARILNIFAN